MTEAEWLASDDPLTMLGCLEPWVADGIVSDRQLRLFVCACSRKLRNLLTDEARQQTVELAERFVDGKASEKDLWLRYGDIHGAEPGPETPAEPALARCCIWQDAAYGSPYYYFLEIQNVLFEKRMIDEGATRSALLRDIFGNPFRPVTFSPDWRSDTVVALARQMYESRDFSAMPILADALEDAGCDNPAILDHCRGSGPHVRGCWPVDLILGKS